MDRPIHLYHYSNLSAFQSIVDSSSLWFSNISNLNDLTERKFGNQIFSSHVQMKLKQWTDELFQNLKGEFDQDDLEVNFVILKEWFFALDSADIYSASMSYRYDDLMMWRSYSSMPTGVCIGFDGVALNKAIEKEIKNQAVSYVFGKIRYPNNAQPLKDSHLVPSTKNYLKKLKEDFLSEIRSYAIDSCAVFRSEVWRPLRDEIDLHSVMYKNPAFKSEQEFRYAISTWSKEKLRFCQKGTRLCSYYELKIPELTTLITTVLIGPTPDAESTLNSVRHFLDAKGVNLNKCMIGISKIPYRAW